MPVRGNDGGDNESVCIGSLEHHLHKVFASVRVPGEDFVYAPSKDFFDMLDDYCNDETFHLPRLPVLITGESGTGKSALLSNWLLRRRRNAARSRAHAHTADEFVFWHAVGCTRQSLNVNSLIRRLMVDLKSRFDLSREVPIAQERLSWELPRFLEMAAKRGRLIIVIDGLHRLVTNEDTEASLSWLPLEFPPNVRVILTVTESPFVRREDSFAPAQLVQADTQTLATHGAVSLLGTTLTPQQQPHCGDGIDATSHVGVEISRGRDDARLCASDSIDSSNDFTLPCRSRIIAELERRQWAAKTLRPLDRSLCRSVVEMYVQKSVQIESARIATTGSFLTQAPGSDPSALDMSLGLLMFDTQVAALLTHPQGGTPLFLRLFLRSAQCAVSRGFSLWDLWDNWLGADTIPELLRRIIYSFETGRVKTAVGDEQCTAKTVAAGGLPALRLLYPWHPGLQETQKLSSDQLRVDVIATVELSAFVHENTHGNHTLSVDNHQNHHHRRQHSQGYGSDGHTSHVHINSLSNMVTQNLGDQMLLQAAALAHEKFTVARKRAEESIENLLQTASNSIAEFLQLKIDELSCLEDQASLDASMQSVVTEASDSSAVTLEYIESLAKHVAESKAGREKHEIASATAVAAARTAASLRIASHATISGSVAGTSSVPSHPSATTVRVHSDNLDSNGRASTANSESNLDNYETQDPNIKLESEESNESASPEPRAIPSSPEVASRESNLAGFLLIEDEETQETPERREVNPSEGIDTLPTYLRGGATVAGFNTLLGNALALLYVARHGLKEQELWGLLATLQRQEDATAQAQRELLAGTLDDTAHSKSMLDLCFAIRGPLEDLWRADDSNHSGLLTETQLLRGMQRIHPAITREDLLCLIENLGLAVSQVKSLVHEAGIEVTLGDGSSYEHIDGDAGVKATLLTADCDGSILNVPGESNQNRTSVAASDVTRFDYTDLLRRVVKLRKSERVAETRTKLSRETESVNRNSLDSFEANFEDGGKATLRRKVNNWSLGSVLEESLLLVLCALGVLHSPEHQILVLPSDADILRQVVHSQFVDNRGGEATWHGHLIRHFSTEANSMRRCEELPWHLQICRRWVTMKEALVDLNTFVMMYDSSDLRDEFMAYWSTLTNGPMYVSNEAHRSAAMARQKHSEETIREDRHRDPELALLCMEMDVASARHMTDKEARKYRLRFQVGIFDVVEEFNKSVELWVATTKPDPQTIRSKCLHIAAFLAEFGSKMDSGKKTPFLRMGCELRMLELFGVDFDILRDFMQNSESSSLDISDAEPKEDKKRVVPQLSTGRTILQPMFPTPTQLLDNNVYYLRWIWGQFPWIALQSAGDVGSVLKVGGLASVLAEISACGVRLNSANYTIPGDGVEAVVDRAVSSDSVESGIKQLTRVDNAVARSTRLWDVKKFDPSQYQLKPSAARLRANINAAMTPNVLLDGMELALRRVRDDIIACGQSINKIPPKYRRSLDQESQLFKDIPHAYHSVRSVKLNTLFPSIEAAIKEKNENTMDNPTLYANATAQLKRGGPGLPLESTLESELKRLTDEETMVQWNLRRGGALPSASAEEVEFERELERMSKLRALADRINTLVRERQTVYESLRRQAEARDASDEEVSHFMLAGETAIETLKAKLQIMTDALEEGRKLNNGYSLLIEVLQANPPSSEQHIISIQQQVTLARQQLADLRLLRQRLYLEAERLETTQKVQISDKLNYYRTARLSLGKKGTRIGATRATPSVLAKLESGSNYDVTSEASGEPVVTVTWKDLGPVSGVSGGVDGATNRHVTDALKRGFVTELERESIGGTLASEKDLLADDEDSIIEGETLKQRLRRQRQEKLRREQFAAPHEYKYDTGALAHNVLSNLFRPWEETKAEMDSKARATQAKMMFDFVMKNTNRFVFIF